MDIKISPIGIIHNEHKVIKKRVHFRSERSSVVVYPEYANGLYRIEESEYVEIIFYFHISEGYSLICKTPHWGKKGVFASRSPFRPVPLGLTKVRLVAVKDNELIVEGLDAVDGTPVMDIKPYVDWNKINKKKEMS